MAKATKVVYDESFYEDQRTRSAGSARIVIPIVQEIVHPQSVLDVGCGVGTWVGAWLDAGLSDVRGVDGEYVQRSMLVCPDSNFYSHDLNSELNFQRKFDLVTCLEVAEHLNSASASVLINSLTRHSDVVMFSAAIPRQGGTHHVNEQWPSYWVKIFEASGYQPFDIIRSQIWDNSDVEWWYRQNILLFASAEAARRYNLHPNSGPIDIVHPALFESFSTPKVQLLAQRVKSIAARMGLGTGRA